MHFLTGLSLFSALVSAALLMQAGREIIPSADTIRALQLTGACGLSALLADLIRSYAFKVGGLTFVRLGRLSFSFCITRH